MRSATQGVFKKDLSQTFSPDETLDIFRKVCKSRFFELKVKKAYDSGLIKCPIYLSLGQESISSALAVVYGKDYEGLFAQHRCHDIYLAFGGDPAALRDELLHRLTGCAKGMGGSASIHDPKIKMFGHDGLMGTQVPIAVDYAWLKGNVIAFMGDASCEEDWIQPSLARAAKLKAPILFVCADNGLSILTKTEVRRNWRLRDIANSSGLPAVDITDDPWLIMYYVKFYKEQCLPALLNIHTVRHLWHAGTGKDSEPEWNRYDLIKNEMKKLKLAEDVEAIELCMQLAMDELWDSEIEKELAHIPKSEKKTIYFKKEKPNVAETICRLTEEHVKKNGGLVYGQCLSAVGRVQNTVPDLEAGIAECPMSDVAWPGSATGAALAGRRPILVVRYQGFQHFNAAIPLNFGAKAKEMWGYNCAMFIRSIAMDGGMGPVASGSHHSIFTRMPGVRVYAPMTPKEWEDGWHDFLEHEDVFYCSEHRRSYLIDYEMPDIIYTNGADITLFPISSTRLNTIGDFRAGTPGAIDLLAKEGIKCNVIHVKWLKPHDAGDKILDPLASSKFGGMVIDGDYENGVVKCLAYDLMQRIDKKVYALGLEDRSAGFAPHLDNLPPTPERIANKVKEILNK